MKTYVRRILTCLTALSMAVPQMPAFHVNAVSAAKATAAASEPVPVSAEADTAAPAVTTGPAEAYAANTGTCTTAPILPAPAVTTTATTVTTFACDDYVEKLKHTFDPSKDHSRYTNDLSTGGMDSKTEYQIGEEIDPSQIYISACGSYENENTGETVFWDIFPEPLTYMDEYEIDDSKFDNTKPGKYEITVYLPWKGLDAPPDADGLKGTFTVEVVEPAATTAETTVLYGGTDNCCVTHVDGSGKISFDKVPIKNYLIGQELDLSGIMISGSGNYSYDVGGPYGRNPKITPWHTYYEPLENYVYEVDASNFDNTKCGIYTINVTLRIYDENGTLEPTGSFTVAVYDSPNTTTTTPIDGYRDFSCGSITKFGNPKSTYKVGEKLDLSGLRIWASGYAGYAEGTGLEWWNRIEWEIEDQPLSKYNFKVDASDFNNQKPGKYSITVSADIPTDLGTVTASGSFTVNVINDRFTTAATTTTTTTFTTCTTEDPWEAIWQEGTCYDEYNWWMSDHGKAFYYDDAPTDGYVYRSWNVGDDFTIVMPYSSKKHQPMYDTGIQMSGSDAIDQGLVSPGYFTFTDTKIIWHSTALSEGDGTIWFYTDSENGIGWEGSYRFELHINERDISTTVSRETGYYYRGGDTSFTSKLNFNEQRETVTVPYPEADDSYYNYHYYNVELTDADGNVINNKVFFTKDYILIPDITKLAKNETDDTVQITVKSKLGSYKADYVIYCKNVSNDKPLNQFLKNTGDINQDGTLDVKDGVLLARIVGGDTTFQTTDAVRKQADVNGDTKTNALDLTLLLRKLARLI